MSARPRFSKKILLMMAVAMAGFAVQTAITLAYPASEFAFTTGLALAIFCVVVAVQIGLYSRVRKEVPGD